ncbi:type II secretion system F family protein [Kribbella deserti]|uniref:Type II secretion system F family protein n=1 Tax=Kribbella deserti TaxID=1926257 RepID=A0ABV6QSM6_9ACTN
MSRAQVLPACVTFAVAVALLAPGRPGPRRLVAPPPPPWNRWLPTAGREISPRERRLHRAASWSLAAAMLFLLGMPWGVLPAAASMVAVPLMLARLQPASVRQRAERIRADLPLTIDLLAACLRAGRPPDEAVATVVHAHDGPLSELLSEVERHLRLGADPAQAWETLQAEPACVSLTRAVTRALRSGAPLAATLEYLADDIRQERRWTAEERARAVETRSVVPLGLCFLPSFILLGVIPTIAGSLTGLLALTTP